MEFGNEHNRRGCEGADLDAGSLACSIQEWLDSLRAFDVKALVILGPGSADNLERRQVWAAHPALYRPAAEAFAASDA
jgi:hypothetical protein